MSQSHLRIVPLSLAEANWFVRHLHRHHPPAKGHKFNMGVVDDAGELRGAAIIGRPLSRLLDTGRALEVLRVATDGCANACSCLYGAAARAGRVLGYERVYTYILADEPGTSLRAAGWTLDKERAGGRPWNMPGRSRTDVVPVSYKQRWVVDLTIPRCA